MIKQVAYLLIAAIVICVASKNSFSQIDLNRLENGINTAKNIKDKFKKDKNKEQTNEEQDNTTKPENNTNNNEEQNNTQNVEKPKEPTLQLYSKFDFVPGEKILFFDDFSQDNLNEIPLYWNTDGRGEVLTLPEFPGVNWFRMNCDGTNRTETKLNFADNTTIEFDLIPATSQDGSYGSDFGFRIFQTREEEEAVGAYVPGLGGFQFKINGGQHFEASSWKEGGYSPNTTSATTQEVIQNLNKKIHFSIWIQKTRVRLYVNQYKVLDAPYLVPKEIVPDRVDFWSSCYDNTFSLLVTNFKIAVGTPDTRNKLLTEGKYVTTGIKFDSGSDKIKPESFAVLKEIAEALKSDEKVRVKIVGHTDSDGDDKMNLDLSPLKML